jgi:hypothetical protein
MWAKRGQPTARDATVASAGKPCPLTAYRGSQPISERPLLRSNLLRRKLTADELDEFIDTFVDIVVGGHESGVAYHFGPLEKSKHASSLNSILRFRIDAELDRWTIFNEPAQRFYTVPPLGLQDHILGLMNKRIDEAIKQLPDIDFQRPLKTQSAHERESAHERTLGAERNHEQSLRELFEPWEQLHEKELQAHVRAQMDEALAKIAELETAIRSRPAPAPDPQPYGVSPRGAELLVTDWMRHIGIVDAQVTPEQADGGIDVSSKTHIAQVKHYTGNVSVVELRELFGVATARGKQGLFFTSNGYTADALAFASIAHLPLFIYNAEQGSLKGITTEARAMLAA